MLPTYVHPFLPFSWNGSKLQQQREAFFKIRSSLKAAAVYSYPGHRAGLGKGRAVNNYFKFHLGRPLFPSAGWFGRSWNTDSSGARALFIPSALHFSLPPPLCGHWKSRAACVSVCFESECVQCQHVRGNRDTPRGRSLVQLLSSKVSNGVLSQLLFAGGKLYKVLCVTAQLGWSTYYSIQILALTMR